VKWHLPKSFLTWSRAWCPSWTCNHRSCRHCLNANQRTEKRGFNRMIQTWQSLSDDASHNQMHTAYPVYFTICTSTSSLP
jgi:hypothetical protein